MQNFHTEQVVIIDGIDITERQEITLQNMNRLPAYQEWKKSIDDKKDM